MRICAVTAARSEFGLLRWILEEIRSTKGLDLDLVVTGAHLASDQGMTVGEIEASGIPISARMEMMLSGSSRESIVKSMGVCSLALAEVLPRLRPDILLVLGDRYELLPICSAALLLNIPIAHISGGDITEGAIDDQVRHAITKLSAIHFPGTQDTARRLVQMGEDPSRVHVVGEPGLEAFRRLNPTDRSSLAQGLGLDANRDWLLVTLHPETNSSLEQNLKMAENLIRALDSIPNVQIVATYANSDFGGVQINESLEQWGASARGRVVVVKSLGQQRYLSLMLQVALVLGNSSSGIVEAPAVPVRAIDIGNRQTGRHRCSTVFHCGADEEEIKAATECLLREYRDGASTTRDTYYGDGYTSSRVAQILLRYSESPVVKLGFKSL